MTTVRVLSRDAAVRGGARHFGRRATIDMERLARELAVSRATLYRTVGSRDALLADVLCAIGRHIVDGIVSDPGLDGVDGVIEVSRRFALALDAAEPLRRFAVEEPETAHRVLLTTTGPVHRLAVDIQRRLFLQIGGIPPPSAACADLLTQRAFLYIRILESVLYGSVLAGRRADFTLAEPALRAVVA